MPSLKAFGPRIGCMEDRPISSFEGKAEPGRDDRRSKGDRVRHEGLLSENGEMFQA